MAEEISSPLLALIKEQSLIDDLQYEEVVAEHKRAGTSIFQILQDFGIMDLDSILHVMANHLGAEMIRDDVQDRVKVHDPEILQDLKNRRAGAFVFRDDFFVLQVVNETLLFDQRQQWT